MSPFRTFSLTLLIASTLLGSAALAQEDFSNQIRARQSVMRLNGFDIGILGGMASGKMPYDAKVATEAAENLAAVASVHIDLMFPEGSAAGSVEGTRAKPQIWADMEDFMSKWEALGGAAAAVVPVAGNGVEALGPALGAVGGACKACHEKYQMPKS